MTQQFFRNTLPSDLEAIASIVASGGLEPIAGLAGIAGTIFPGPPGQGSNWVKNVQDLAYQPRDPSSLNQLGSALEVPMDLYEKGVNYLGDTTFKHTGSPTLSSIAKAAPEILGGGYVLKQLMKGKSLPQMSQDTSPPIDPSRRKFVKNLGLATAGAVAAPHLLKKSLLDAPAAPAAKKTAAIAAKAIPSVSPKLYSAAHTLKAIFHKDALKEIVSGDRDALMQFKDNDINLSGVDPKVAAELALKDKIHMDKPMEIDMSYTLDNPFNSMIDARSMPEDLVGKLIEGLASRKLSPDTFTKDVRKYMDADNLDYELMEPERKYIESILDSDDPVGEVFQRSTQTELENFGEIQDRYWLYPDKQGRIR